MAASRSRDASGSLLAETRRIIRPGDGLEAVFIRLPKVDARALNRILEELDTLGDTCDTTFAMDRMTAVLLLPKAGTTRARKIAETIRTGLLAGITSIKVAYASLHEAFSRTARKAPDPNLILAKVGAALDGIEAGEKSVALKLGEGRAASTIVGADEKNFLFSGTPRRIPKEKEAACRHRL